MAFRFNVCQPCCGCDLCGSHSPSSWFFTLPIGIIYFSGPRRGQEVKELSGVGFLCDEFSHDYFSCTWSSAPISVGGFLDARAVVTLKRLSDIGPPVVRGMITQPDLVSNILFDLALGEQYLSVAYISSGTDHPTGFPVDCVLFSNTACPPTSTDAGAFGGIFQALGGGSAAIEWQP